MFLLGLVGCSSTSGLRPAATPKMRTVASIGDKPLPIVTGEPGDSLTAENETPERHSRAGSDGRISGRVVDENGEPVANAQVRLAVSSAAGGRVARATTDRGGGFTLRGLRPGSTYTVIAEWEDAQGVLTGRSKVEAPDTDVRIALAPSDAEPLAADNSKRVNHVSRRDAPGNRAEEQVAEVVGIPINVEDLPPAPEADDFSPATRRQVEVEPGSSGSGTRSRPGNWRSGARSGAAAAEPVPAADSEPGLAPRRDKADSPVEATTPDEDGPNPLPPALESGEASLRRQRPAVAQRDATAQRTNVLPADDVAPSPPETPPGSLVASPRSSRPARGAATEALESPPPPAELPPPVAEVARSGVSGPVAPGPELPPPAEVPASAPAASGPVASGSELPPPVESAEPTPPWLSKTETAPPPPAAPARPRPRWRDVAASAKEPVPMEGAQGTRVVATGASEPNTTRVVRGSPKEPETFCRFDPKLRRIEDFRLPDLQGRPVRFQDFDSDLVLLDFWGTWCQPCIRSVPHLVDIQKRLGGKQLQVVGIACEREETPPAQRVAGVAKTSEKLGINYPVLVSSLDGTCPLQNALHVQAFPTLILVDRQGRILWQDQGATKMTMTRLDRMLSLATKPSSDGRRRY
jgi:thiol-disulfide isomerase/thioredoxin